ncbi:hypothetical protein BCR32DRAFT_291273 [Anaeromyces robustus]|uniref:EF-hand domain-containing protein n=1 Tax=Anaeromyces robustus TaxID=1754192 RepID=A0A1Y1XGM9_9FUNG|nr:hypothetical protein BCR32DRAFT_291273 [Anaeromyces robustus]|eukprot:ORX84556.1 hypothetical protein BCR32DRAFT_291273 [Anaeromyces robustus]
MDIETDNNSQLSNFNNENVNEEENEINDDDLIDNEVLNETDKISQPQELNKSKENLDNENNNTKSNSSKSYTRIVNIDNEEVVKPLDDIKNEYQDSTNSISKLHKSRKGLYSGSFSSYPQISKSNKELYQSVVQKKYQLGNNKNYEKKERSPITEEITNEDTEQDLEQCCSSKESIHYHLQDPMASQSFCKEREKVKYIESNMVDVKSISVNELSEEEIKKKNDRWLCPIYLNNEKYKKNFEVDVNNLSVQLLAQEFLTNENVDLETRAYLLESVFPILCVSLKKLLIELDRRKIIERNEKPTEFVVDRNHNAVPRDVPFDSINWLAQYLYRNNPKYSNYSDITSTPYLKSIKTVTTTLKAKLFEMDINKKALKRADELARKREEKRQQKIMEAMYIEKKRTYSNLLISLYKQWVKKLWRKDDNLYLTQYEILDCIKSVLEKYEPNSEDDDFKGKLDLLIQNITIEFNNMIKTNEEKDEIKIEEIAYIDNSNDKQNEQENNELIIEIDINENNENTNNNNKNDNQNSDNDDTINNNNEPGNKNIDEKDIKENENMNNEDNEKTEKNNNDNDNVEDNENKNNGDNANDDKEENQQGNTDDDQIKLNSNNSSENISNKSNEIEIIKELHIQQDRFVEIILNNIIEWKIEDVSQLISLIIENTKIEESEMNRIFEIISQLPGLILLEDEWKKFIENNTEKLELPQHFKDDKQNNVDIVNAEDNEIIKDDQVNDQNDISENLEQGLNKVNLLELKENIKITDNICTIIISQHNDGQNETIPVNENNENTNNSSNNVDNNMEKESFIVNSRFEVSVENLINYLKNNPLTSISDDLFEVNSDEIEISHFQKFIKDIISTYSAKAALFTFYQLNYLKLREIEEARREEIRRKEEEILQKRIRKMKLIFKSVDKEGSGNVLVKILNTVFENVPTSVGDMEFLKYPLEVQDMFVYLKIPVMARALLTKTISEQEFVDHVLNVCSSLSSEHFDIVLQLILDSLGIKDEEEETEENKNENNVDNNDENSEISSREKDQIEVLKMIWTLMKNPNVDISEICDLGLTWTIDTIKKYNTSGQIIGDIVINDPSFDANEEGDKKEQKSSEEIEKHTPRLVYISADNTGKEYLENIDKQFSVLDNPKSSIIEAFENNTVKITKCNESLSEGENIPKDTLILNVPFTGKDNQIAIGVLSLQLKPNNNNIQNTGENEEKSSLPEFSNEDISFIKNVGKVLGYAIEHTSNRERSNAILESCSTYILDLLKNNNVNLYLVEKLPSKAAIENLGKKKKKKEAGNNSDSDNEEPFSKEDYTYVMYVSDKPTEEDKKKILKKNNKKKVNDKNNKNEVKFQKSEKDNVLKKITKKDKNRNLLMESVNTNDIVTRHDTEIEDETVTAIPIIDQMNQCIGMISMNTKLAENDPSFIEEINELKQLAHLIAGAMEMAEQENKKNSKPLLYAETISEQLRRKLFFPKLLLLKARDNLSKVDNNSIAELKSYRVPPTIIHKVICCILYIFGYTPKQVESWQDAARYINQDLLRRMQQYDSTAKQKGSIFKRIKQIIRKYIKVNDIRKQSSLPAQCMYDWLLVCLTLRSIAIRNRRSNKEENIFASNEYEEEEEVFEDEAEEEQTLNYILNHQNKNSRNFKSLFNLSSKKNDESSGSDKEKTIHYSFSYSRLDKLKN